MRNRNNTQRISLFNFLVLTFVSAGIIVFFVNNIIAVNKLGDYNNELRNDLNKTININNALMTETERLSNFDNIKFVAVDKLKLRFPDSKPKKITVAKSELNN
jgi:cell division protein FtsL